MTPLSWTCDVSTTHYHVAQREHGKIVRMNDSMLLSICQHCKKPIERAHRRSTSWFIRPDVNPPFVPAVDP